MARKKNYLNNKDLIIAVIASKKQGSMTDTLARMLMLLTERYGRKPNYSGYTYNDDMQAFAMLTLVKVWDRFDETKYSNAFAYYTSCVHNAFNQFLNKERTQRDVRDEILVSKGLDPSLNYTMRHEQEMLDLKDENNS